jgi:uncharacterized protein (TIGR03663 family)
MTRGCIGALVAIALATGLALRVARLDVRPMHHDEANQAVKFGTLLERGEYRYDAHDHHGPTLYYLSLPAAWLSGETTLASLDERTLRGVPAAFGVATIGLLLLMAPAVGRTAAAAGAWLMALSPAMVFYSRMFIQESLFTCFTLAFAIAIGRMTMGGGLKWSVAAGLAGGLAVATKETSLVVLPAAIAACSAAWVSLGPARRQPIADEIRWGAAGLAVAATVAALFFSSFLAFPEGVVEPLRGVGTYLNRGIDPVSHAHPWHYYLGLLAYHVDGGLRWSEGLVLALAVAAVAAAWRSPLGGTQGPGGLTAERPGEVAWVGPGPSRAEGVFWARYFLLYVALAGGVFSLIRYKTPWNLLPFYVGVLVLAGIGFSTLVHAPSPRTIRGVLAGAFVLASANLGWQAWRASVTYAADPRNPYVYAQSVPDTVRMAARVRALAALHPEGNRMQVSVIASPYEQWPLPWYLRAMPHVGYWSAPGDTLALEAPVVVASMEHTAALDLALGDRYVSEFYGLRPEVLLALYVERGLWERYLARVTGQGAAQPAGDGSFAPAGRPSRLGAGLRRTAAAPAEAVRAGAQLAARHRRPLAVPLLRSPGLT